MRRALPLLIAVLLSAPALYAQPKPSGPSKVDREKARVLFDEAEAYYNVGEWAQALESYKQAYLLSREPALLFNMAQCYRQLGKNEEAIRTYKNFLKEVPDTPLKPKVDALITELEALVAKSKAALTTPPTEPIKSGANTPPSADPKATEPKVTEPKTAEPKATEPAADPKATEPKVTEPKTAEPTPASLAVTPGGGGPAEPVTPKKSKTLLFVGIGGGVLGAIVLGVALSAGEPEPRTDLGTFRPFN
jgi:hypothetical protein